jgi:hypothetical protein
MKNGQNHGRLFTVWPHLLTRELIAVLLVSVFLIVVSILFQAPLEAPANPAKSPNPAKAPWYFVGFQELLVYFDPWFTGVLLPLLAITGLMLIPFMDVNPRGNGYYTFRERPMAVSLFVFMWLFFWVMPTIIGTFFRGPNWAFFGLFETWDPARIPATASRPYLFHGAAGLLFILMYYGLFILLSAKLIFKNMRQSMGGVRFYLFMVYFWTLWLVPLKMVLRWVFGLKYFIVLPEIDLNL